MKSVIYRALNCLFLLWIVSGCNTPQKLYQNGNYDLAISKAVKKLKKNPNKEGLIVIMEKSFLKANEIDNSRVNFLKLEGNPQSWDEIYVLFNSLKNRQQKVRQVIPIKIPSTGRIIQFTFIDYDQEIINAKKKAAEYLYTHAMTLIEKGDRESAKSAYRELLRVKDLYSNFQDVDTQIKKARELATLKIVVESIPMHSRTLEISNEFFENKIHEYLISLSTNEFVKFYSQKEANSFGLVQPDQVVKLKFDDFIVGQTNFKEEVFHLVKDSVVVGTVNNADGTKQNVYGSVKADLHHFKKSVNSNGLLDFKIIEARTGKVLTQEKFPGQFVWNCEWGFFNGDERALNDKQKKITKLREIPPPPPQDLFIEFTKPIYNQITAKMRDFYSGY